MDSNLKREKVKRIFKAVGCVILLSLSVLGIVFIINWGFFGVNAGPHFVEETNSLYKLLPIFLLLSITSILRLIAIVKDLSKKTEMPTCKTEKWIISAYAVFGGCFLLGVLAWGFPFPIGEDIDIPLCQVSLTLFSVVFLISERMSRGSWIKDSNCKKFTSACIVVLLLSLISVYVTDFAVEKFLQKIGEENSVVYLYKTSLAYFSAYLVSSIFFATSAILFAFTFKKSDFVKESIGSKMQE